MEVIVEDATTTAHPGQPGTCTLHVPCRYYRVWTTGTPCVEQKFHHVERTLPLPLDQTALVLVDVWSTHYIDTWLARAKEVTRTRIAPLLEAARRIGLTVIHAPSPFIADRYLKGPPRAVTTVEPAPPNWPPAAFRGSTAPASSPRLAGITSPS